LSIIKSDIGRYCLTWTSNVTNVNVDDIEFHETVRYLKKRLHSELSMHNNGIILHGGCVSNAEGNAIAILGHTGAGKTTLIAYLTSIGYFYHSEDMLLLRNDGKVVPFPSPICLRNDSVDLLREHYGIRINGFKCGFLEHRRILWKIHPPEYSPVPMQAFIILIREPGQHAKLNRTSSTQAMDSIVDNMFGVQDLYSNLRTAFVLSQRTPVYTLRYSKLNEAADCISRLFSGKNNEWGLTTCQKDQ
jgi:hypothetical protein